MSIADKLEKLTTDITSAYDAVEEKGGTLPEHKNTDSLPDAIRSIESGEAGEITGYGRLLYYWDVTDDFFLNGMECEVEIADKETFETWWSENGQPRELTYESGSWSYFNKQTGEQVNIPDISAIGLSVELWGEDFAMININKEVVVNTESGLRSLDLDAEGFAALFGVEDRSYVEIDGKKIYNVSEETPYRFYFGPDITTFGDDFIYTSEMDTVYGTNVTSIGNNFWCRSCSTFSLPKLTSLGNNVIIQASAIRFNSIKTIGDNCNLISQSIQIANSVETIGNNCQLQGQSSFPMTFTKLVSVGNSFRITSAVTGAASINFPKLESIGNYFMSNTASAGGMRIMLDKCKTIGTNFMKGYKGYFQLYLNGGTLTSIGENFLTDCGSAYGGVSVGTTSANVVQGTTQQSISNYPGVSGTDVRNLPIYALGVTFSGGSRSSWLSRFPTMTTTSSSGYSIGRKTMDAGY